MACSPTGGTVLNLWDLAWHVFDRVDTLMGVGAAALAARQLARRLKDRVSCGRSVVSEHYGDWRQRQGDPATLALFLSRTPRTRRGGTQTLDTDGQGRGGNYFGSADRGVASSA